MLKEYLEFEGFDVRTFDDGAAAWSAVEAGDALPHAIILDHHMPRMDGREFRRRQLERGDVETIPVLVFTAGGPLVIPGALVVSKSTPVDAIVVMLRAACHDAAPSQDVVRPPEEPVARERGHHAAAQRKRKRQRAEPR